jgi:hypothetical protein
MMRLPLLLVCVWVKVSTLLVSLYLYYARSAMTLNFNRSLQLIRMIGQLLEQEAWSYV